MSDQQQADGEQLYLNLLERYPFACAACGYEQNAAPSMFMSCFQMNTGAGRCLKCDTRLTLMIDEKNEGMRSFVVRPPDHLGALPDACYATKDVVLASRNAESR